MREKPPGFSFLSLLGKLAVSAITILITVLFLEGGVRLLKPQDPDLYNGDKFMRLYPPPGEPQSLVPHIAGNYTGVPVQINSLGLRDREVAIPKPPGLFRAVAIGDSITFGFGVRLEESYPKRLEARLNAGFDPSSRRVEVINAGVPATSLASYLQFLEMKGPGLQPDLVLIGIAINDIFDYDAVSRPVSQPSQNRSSRLVPALRQLNRALLLHSHLYLLSYVSVKSLLIRTGFLDLNQAYAEDFLPVQSPSERQARAWASTLRLLGRLVETARGLHVPIVLVLFPIEPQLDAQALDLYRHTLRLGLTASALEGIPQRRLAEFARSMKVPFVDLLPRFRESRDRGLFLRNRSVSHDWTHPSSVGHEMAADEILSTLQQLELVPPKVVPAMTTRSPRTIPASR